MEAFTSCLAVYPTLSQFQAADYDSIADETLYDFNEVYSSGMVSLLNKMNAIYQCWESPYFLLALLALLVLTVRVIHGLFHGDRTDLELWILSCGILLSAVFTAFWLWSVYRMVYRRYAKIHQQLLFLRCLYSAAAVKISGGYGDRCNYGNNIFKFS